MGCTNNTIVIVLVGFSLLEIFLFGGIQYGWFAFVFILKKEGVFQNLCILEDSVLKLNISLDNGTSATTECFQQDERLNLIFSIGVAVFSSLTFLTGQLFISFSVTRIRVLYISLGVTGILCLAFTSTENPWLSLPGIILVGVTGQALLISNYSKVLPLISRGSTIYVGLICGCLDSSVLTMLFIKSLYEVGIDKEVSLVFTAVLFIVVTGICTRLHASLQQSESTDAKWQTKRIDVKKDHPVKSSKTGDLVNDAYLEDMRLVHQKSKSEPRNQIEVTSGETSLDTSDQVDLTLRRILTHPLFLSHVVWFCIVVLKFHHFLGSANRFMTQVLQDNRKVSYFTNTMTYIMLGSLVSSFIAGYTMQKSEKLFSGISGTILPLVVTSSLGMLLSVTEFVTTPSALYVDFVLLTFLRSFTYAVNTEFLRITFPAKFISLLYGVDISVAGIVSLTQYGLFAWAEKYYWATTHVNLFMLCLTSLSLLHPILVLLIHRRGRQRINKS